jgi:hypothetical protein
VLRDDDDLAAAVAGIRQLQDAWQPSALTAIGEASATLAEEKWFLAESDAKVVMLFSDGDPNRAENNTAFSNRMRAFREAVHARAAAVCLYAVQVEDELNAADPNQLSQQRLLQCDTISVSFGCCQECISLLAAKRAKCPLEHGATLQFRHLHVWARQTASASPRSGLTLIFRALFACLWLCPCARVRVRARVCVCACTSASQIPPIFDGGHVPVADAT